MTIYNTFPTWLVSLLLFPVGLFVGLFITKLVYRLPAEDGGVWKILFKTSRCPSCKTPIAILNNIPILSWFILKGKCPKCGDKIKQHYPVMEFSSAALFASLVWFFPFASFIWFKATICGIALIVLFFTDLTEFMLPDAIQLPLIMVGVFFSLPQLIFKNIFLSFNNVYKESTIVDYFYNGIQASPIQTVVGSTVSWTDSIIGIVLGYGILWSFANGYVLFNNFILVRVFHRDRISESMGMGDFKMLAWLGAFWGWGHVLGILFFAALIGGIVGISLLVIKKADLSTQLPFGCAIALSVYPVIIYGKMILYGYIHFMFG